MPRGSPSGVVSNKNAPNIPATPAYSTFSASPFPGEFTTPWYTEKLGTRLKDIWSSTLLIMMPSLRQRELDSQITVVVPALRYYLDFAPLSIFRLCTPHLYKHRQPPGQHSMYVTPFYRNVCTSYIAPSGGHFEVPKRGYRQHTFRQGQA